MSKFKFKRLFIIANPTHFLSVKNYLDKYPHGENFVILTVTYFNNYEEFLAIVRNETRLKVLNVFYIDQNKQGISYYLDIIKKLSTIITIRRQHQFFNEICFTNYESWLQNYILNQFKTDKLILLSDGTAILDIIELRLNDRKIPIEGNQFLIKKVFKIKPIENLHFYSPVVIDVAHYDSLEVFDFKASKSGIINSRKIYVIGSPLVEGDFIKSESNLTYLRRLRELFHECEIIYFAHRRENDQNLKNYNFFNNVILDPTPFEKRLEDEPELPGIIISYVSSILINLPQVYPQIKFYYIPLSKEDIPETSQFYSSYLNLKNTLVKIKCKNLEQLILN